MASAAIGGDTLSRIEGTRGELLVVGMHSGLHEELLLAELRGEGYRVRQRPDATSALEAAVAEIPDLILLDSGDPEGQFELCQWLKRHPRLHDIPVIFISAYARDDDEIRAFEVGAADYIEKPVHPTVLGLRVEAHLKARRRVVELDANNLRLRDVVREQIREISDSQMATIFALAKIAEARDAVTGKHIERVQLYCKLLAATLADSSSKSHSIDDSFIENIFLASPLHDIGKVAIRDQILLKPGELSPHEFEEMKTHTVHGAETLEAVRTRYPNNDFLRLGIEIARHHHEHWDGKGYPAGLAGAEIPLSARITAVADAYDAARSRRCYKFARSHSDVRSALARDSGTHFDPDVVRAFEKVQGLFEDVAAALNDG